MDKKRDNSPPERAPLFAVEEDADCDNMCTFTYIAQLDNQSVTLVSSDLLGETDHVRQSILRLIALLEKNVVTVNKKRSLRGSAPQIVIPPTLLYPAVQPIARSTGAAPAASLSSSSRDTDTSASPDASPNTDTNAIPNTDTSSPSASPNASPSADATAI